jgi:DNA processing protein
MNALYIATLQAIPRVGRKTIHHILKTISDKPKTLKDLQEAFAITKMKYSKMIIPTIQQIDTAYNQALWYMDKIKKSDIKIMGFCDDHFPNALKQIPDPPVLLYVKGNIKCLHKEQETVAVVGTRTPTAYGRQMAEQIGEVLAQQEKIVVSGLALGCDTAAHKGCIKANGRTVAVVAHGLGTIYPPENKRLAEQIVAHNGCIISEYHIDEKPAKYYFIERDRIQSGLSNTVMVIETEVDGGTMHTIRFCMQQKKVLSCLQHPSQWYGQSQIAGNLGLLANKQAVGIKNLDELMLLINKKIGN